MSDRSWEDTHYDAGIPARNTTRAGAVGSVDDALALIGDGDRVHVAYSCAAPLTLMDALAANRDRWTALEIVSGTQHEQSPLFDLPAEPFRFRLLQPSAVTSPLVSAGAADVVAVPLSRFAAVCAPGAPLACDVSIVQVSPPGPEGRFSLGTGGADAIEIMRQTPVVVAEVNPRMPYTFGATEVDRSEFDLLVEVEHELPEVVRQDFGDVEEAVAHHAASEVPDGATLQFGIGRIPDAIMAKLAGHRDLGVHSGMIGDACVDLVEAGALTGSAKAFDVNKIVGGVVIGSRRCFDWVDRNPDVMIVPSAYSHGLGTLLRLSRFVAINSVVEVALDGSANATHISSSSGTRVVSGPGGQPDFATAAAANGGISIMALTSTAARGRVSRIVPSLATGIPVTTPHWLADRVVTEFGVAHLAGMADTERARRLRAIAHPEFQSTLS